VQGSVARQSILLVSWDTEKGGGQNWRIR